jgi:hypothetical protein
MTTKQKLIIGGVALLTAFAAGRYTVPERIKIETKTVEVEKKAVQSDADRAKHQDTVTTTIKKTDGTVITTSHTVLDTNTDVKTKSTSTDSIATDQTKEIVQGSSPVTVLAVGAVNLSTPSFSYGLQVSKPILGPITVGVSFLTNGTLAAGVGLTF